MGSFQKLRYYITLNLTFSGEYIYFGIFDSIMRYALQVLDQNNNTTFKEIEKLKAIYQNTKSISVKKVHLNERASFSL